MGSLRKKTYTKPLPANAELFVRKGEQFARWEDKAGKKKTAPTTTGRDDSLRIVLKSRYWLAKFRDGSGVEKEVSTGCKDKAAAQTKLTKFERQAELVRSGVVTAAEQSIAAHQAKSIDQHIQDYLKHLRGRSGSEKYRSSVEACLERLVSECGFRKLADIDVERLEQWLLDAEDSGLGPRTRNRYRSAVVALAGWCVKSGRLSANKLTALPVANEKADRRRQRRALDESEISRLLDAAERRPLIEAMTVRRGRNKGKLLASVKPDAKDRLIRLGRERRLIYLTLLSTGLRKSELRSIRVHQVILNGDQPGIDLLADDEKNSEGSYIPLRADVVDELRKWLDDRRRERADQDVLKFNAGPEDSRADELLFRVPDGLDKIFNKDIELAGIAKRDERGRVVDIHALRTTFCSMLQKAGVAPRVAQEAMRHSDIRLTMATYTDPKLLDIAGAVESLPGITLSNSAAENQVTLTGTCSVSKAKGEAQGEALDPTTINPREFKACDSAPEAWEASVLPLNYTRESAGIITGHSSLASDCPAVPTDKNATLQEDSTFDSESYASQSEVDDRTSQSPNSPKWPVDDSECPDRTAVRGSRRGSQHETLFPEHDLTTALAMIERLPLSDQEKAEAVRRLLAELQSRS